MSLFQLHFCLNSYLFPPKVFGTDHHDWRLLYSEVPGKLKQLAKDGYRILFITNQAGIAKGKVNSFLVLHSDVKFLILIS